RRLDQYYLEGIRPLTIVGSQQAIALGPLMDEILNQERGTAEAQMRQELRNLTALYAVMGTYLLDYQDVYQDCLKPNAIQLTITTQTDTVTKDGFGNEINRVKGWTTKDYYKINPEFEEYFKTIFVTAKKSGPTQMFDLFLNDGRIQQLRQGVRSVTRRMECSSPEIKQLEEGFRAYDQDIERRMQL
ncbi:MAG: hypothetical protein AAF603_03425, partial [Pseudomonadota bacterium]